ncbi:MAG: GNAT family N-acetyltransferase, partial [Elusimicrobia bacterium]|nr:GNAT family N-acetyltransferase [Elusimicrobiota bacterium]
FMAPDGKRATDDYFTVESVDERGIVFAFDSPEQKASAAPKLPQGGGILMRTDDVTLARQKAVLELCVQRLGASVDRGTPTTGNDFVDTLLGFRVEEGGADGEVPAQLMDERMRSDPSQMAALSSMLSLKKGGTVLVQGPPGTGKTSVIREAIAVFPRRGERVLVVSQANAAVNNVAERLKAVGIAFARVGNKEDVISAAIKDEWSLRGMILKKFKAAYEDNHAGYVLLGTMNGFLNDRFIRNEFFFQEFDVVIIEEAARATIAETLVPIMMASEKLILIGDHKQLPAFGISPEDLSAVEEEAALMPGLDGELKELGFPKLKDIFSRMNLEALRRSLFERAVEMMGERGVSLDMHMLNVNRRQHPLLARLVSRVTYGGKLLARDAASDEKERPEEDTLKLIDVPGRDERSGPSSYNTREASGVVHEVQRILNQRLLDGAWRYAPKDILIISPYQAQNEEILLALRLWGVAGRIRGRAAGGALTPEDRTVLLDSLAFRLSSADHRTASFLRQFIEDPYPGSLGRFLENVRFVLPYESGRIFTAEEIEQIRVSVNTIDSIQGQENKVVVLSLVKSNPKNEVGFLGTSDGLQRLNVSISRAQEKMVLIGDFSGTLTRAVSESARECFEIMLRYALEEPCLYERIPPPTRITTGPRDRRSGSVEIGLLVPAPLARLAEKTGAVLARAHRPGPGAATADSDEFQVKLADLFGEGEGSSKEKSAQELKILHERVRDLHHRTLQLALARWSGENVRRRLGSLKAVLRSSGIDRASEAAQWIEQGNEAAAAAILASVAERIALSRRVALNQEIASRVRHPQIIEEKDGRVRVPFGEHPGTRTLYRWQRILRRVEISIAQEARALEDIVFRLEDVRTRILRGESPQAFLGVLEAFYERLHPIRAEAKKDLRRSLATAIDFARLGKGSWVEGTLGAALSFAGVRAQSLDRMAERAAEESEAVERLRRERLGRLKGAVIHSGGRHLLAWPFLSEPDLAGLRNILRRGETALALQVIEEALFVGRFLSEYRLRVVREARRSIVVPLGEEQVFQHLFEEWAAREGLIRGGPRTWRAWLFMTVFISEKSPCFVPCQTILFILKAAHFGQMIPTLRKNRRENLLRVIVGFLKRTPKVLCARMVPAGERDAFLSSLLEAAAADHDPVSLAAPEERSVLWRAFALTRSPVCPSRPDPRAGFLDLSILKDILRALGRLFVSRRECGDLAAPADLPAQEVWNDKLMLIDPDEERSRGITVLRDAVHRLGFWHWEVRVLVFDPQGRLFLQEDQKGHWDIVSGHTGLETDIRSAAARRVSVEAFDGKYSVLPERCLPVARGRSFRQSVTRRDYKNRALVHVFTLVLEEGEVARVSPRTGKARRVVFRNYFEVTRDVIPRWEHYAAGIHHVVRERGVVRELDGFWMIRFSPSPLPGREEVLPPEPRIIGSEKIGGIVGPFEEDGAGALHRFLEQERLARCADEDGTTYFDGSQYLRGLWERGGRFLALSVGDEVRGFLEYPDPALPGEDRVVSLYVYVPDRFRRNGYARRLVRAYEALLRARGISQYVLAVDKTPEAQGFWARMLPPQAQISYRGDRIERAVVPLGAAPQGEGEPSRPRRLSGECPELPVETVSSIPYPLSSCFGDRVVTREDLEDRDRLRALLGRNIYYAHAPPERRGVIEERVASLTAVLPLIDRHVSRSYSHLPLINFSVYGSFPFGDLETAPSDIDVMGFVEGDRFAPGDEIPLDGFSADVRGARQISFYLIGSENLHRGTPARESPFSGEREVRWQRRQRNVLENTVTVLYRRNIVLGGRDFAPLEEVYRANLLARVYDLLFNAYRRMFLYHLVTQESEYERYRIVTTRIFDAALFLLEKDPGAGLDLEDFFLLRQRYDRAYPVSSSAARAEVVRAWVHVRDAYEKIRSRSSGARSGAGLLDMICSLGILSLGIIAPVALAAVGVVLFLRWSRPLLFRQERVGYRGRIFTVYKFRTMTCEREVARRRVTRLGRVLRATGLDETPQIVNILQGEMAFFGPRPLPLEEFADTAASRAYRALFDDRKPGVMSLAMAERGFGKGPRSDEELWRAVALDRYERAHRSWWLGMRIVLGTLRQCLAGWGAVLRREGYFLPYLVRMVDRLNPWDGDPRRGSIGIGPSWPRGGSSFVPLDDAECFIRDVERIDLPAGMNVRREDASRMIERPLVDAWLILYDKGIRCDAACACALSVDRGA